MTRLTRREQLVLVVFSLLYTVNIAISNVSLYVHPWLARFGRRTTEYFQGDGLDAFPSNTTLNVSRRGSAYL